MFTLFHVVPLYDNRDAICGHRAIRHPYNFHTYAGASAVAAIQGERDCRDGGNTVYRVRPVDVSPFVEWTPHQWPAPALLDGDIPF